MQLIDGKALSQTIKEEIAQEVEQIKKNGGKIPHLAAVLIGEDPASEVYVRNKVKSCEMVGLNQTLSDAILLRPKKNYSKLSMI